MSGSRLTNRILPNRLNRAAAIYSDGLTLRYLDIPRPETSTNETRIAQYLHLLQTGTLLNKDLSQEMSSEYLRVEEVPAFTTTMVLLKCGSRYGPNPEVPFDILMLLSQAERLNRDTPGAATVCVIGHSLAEIENPGMTPAQREQNCRYAFALLRLIENLRGFFPSIQAVLDTDLMGTREYKEARKELEVSHGSSVLIAFEMAALSLTVQKIYGVALKVGWSSFADTKEYDAVRKGLAPAQNKIAGCHLAPDLLLKGRIAFLYSLPGLVYSDFGDGQVAEPDVVKPLTFHGKVATKDGRLYYGRVFFNPRHAQIIDDLTLDAYSLSIQELRKHISRQKQTHKLLTLMRELGPHEMPEFYEIDGDLSNSRRLLDLCKENAKDAAIAGDGIAAAERELELAVRAHCETLSNKNAEESKFLVREFGVDSSAVASNHDRVSVPMPAF